MSEIMPAPIRSLEVVGRMLHRSGGAMRPLPPWRVARIEERALRKIAAAFSSDIAALREAPRTNPFPIMR